MACADRTGTSHAGPELSGPCTAAACQPWRAAASASPPAFLSSRVPYDSFRRQLYHTLTAAANHRTLQNAGVERCVKGLSPQDSHLSCHFPCYRATLLCHFPHAKHVNFRLFSNLSPGYYNYLRLSCHFPNLSCQFLLCHTQTTGANHRTLQNAGVAMRQGSVPSRFKQASRVCPPS